MRHPLSARRPSLRACRHAVAAACACLLAGPALALDPSALPTQGQVTTGSAAIATQPGQLTVTQASGRVAIDWSSFHIGSAARVDFVQPGRDAVAINRVVGGEASLIQGRLQSNGQVYLVNPNGVVFGAGAEVQVGGLLATTLALAERSTQRNRISFSGTGGAMAEVRNDGSIRTTEGGFVVLLGRQVSNGGTVSAPGGQVELAAAGAATLEFGGDGRIALGLNAGVAGARADNTGLLQADGGAIAMRAQGIGTGAPPLVNQAGVVRALAVDTRGGVVRLSAPGGQVQLSGPVDVAAATGQGAGQVDTRGARVLVTADARVALDGGGRWTLAADSVAVGSDVAAPALAASLARGDVTLTATQGALSVDAPVAWTSHGLTLEAAQGISVNATLDAGLLGSGRLQLAYGLAAPAAGNGADYRLADGAKINLPAGSSFGTRLGSDGAALDYTVINRLGSDGGVAEASLQGLAGRLDGRFALGADIDAAASASWDGGRGFAPIGSVDAPFTGRLAGLGHSVGGLVVARSTNAIGQGEDAGLFGAIRQAQVRDIGLVGGSVRGQADVGALVAVDRGGSRLDHVWVDGTTVSGYAAVGGLVGTQSPADPAAISTYRRLRSNAALALYPGNAAMNVAGGVIGFASLVDMEGVQSTATVPLARNAGGVVGRIDGGRMVDVHASTHVSATGAGTAGGLAGRATLGAFSDSSASGDVGAPTGAASALGGLVGVLSGTAVGERLSASGQVSSGVNGASNVGGLVGTSSIDLRDSIASGAVTVLATAAGATVGNVGGLAGQLSGSGVSSGLLAQGAVTVSAPGQVSAVGGLVGNSTAALSQVRATGNVSASSVTAQTTALSDGVGGLVGLQGAAAITNASAAGQVTAAQIRYVGGLVGFTGGALQQVSATGDVLQTGSGTSAGGLVGRLDRGSLVNAFATGSVTGATNSVGGLVGVAGSGTSIGVAYATGAVSGQAVVGGLVGNGAAVLDRVFATGNVSGGALTGGLAGQQLAGVSNAYATGSVTGSSSVGGLVGGLSGSIANSHATGRVTGGIADVGGLVGRRLAGAGTVSASFWNTQTSGQATSAGGNGLTSAQMADPGSYAGWDLGTAAGGASIWLLLPGQAAPTLRGLTPALVQAAGGALPTLATVDDVPVRRRRSSR